MSLNLNDSVNPAETRTNLNLIQTLNTFAFVIKSITGKSSWKIPPSVSLETAGIPGDKGDKGDTGLQGVQGLKGDKGDKGDTGLQGVQGLKGDKGDKGDTGLQGVQGLKGDKGDTGLQGIQGLKGDTGATGSQGVQGLKGDKGDTGAIGPQGVQGEPTSTAPQAWQDIPLASAWSNYATGFVNAQCRKLVGDLIEVRGTIKKSSATVANEIVATLPIGYRPIATMHFITWASNGYSRLQVDANGTMRLISGNPAGLGFNFIFGLN